MESDHSQVDICSPVLHTCKFDAIVLYVFGYLEREKRRNWHVTARLAWAGATRALQQNFELFVVRSHSNFLSLMVKSWLPSGEHHPSSIGTAR